jgi:hypothetical protein
VKPVENLFGDRAQFVYDERWDVEALKEHHPDLVLCLNDWPYEVAQCLDVARNLRTPSLVLQDGILEWRCQYENPLFGSGGGAPQHQPVLADKIACLGNQSARQIAAWGNAHKVEVTGMPRLDYLVGHDFSPPKRPGSRLLVMTAKNAGFTDEQKATTLQSLRDVKTHLAGLQGVEQIWRIGRSLAETLGVENRFTAVSSQELVSVLQEVDAVITTPSTAMLEAMILRRPVAALDYHNVPRFVPTAWTISSYEHIPHTVAELLNPPHRKLEFQGDCLRDCLACDSPASRKVVRLIEEMVAWGHEARSKDSPWNMPANLLGAQLQAIQAPQVRLSELYPENPLFADCKVESLQVRLARLQKRNEELQKNLENRSLARGMYTFGKKIAHYFSQKT